MTYIYTLSDPRTGLIRYVGKSDNPTYRLKTHLRKETTLKSRWIQSLVNKGLRPILEILAEVPFSEWQFWEQYWIAQLKAWGYVLTNGDNGGLGHYRLTNHLKRKISDTLKGRPNLALEIPVAQYSLSGDLLQVYPSGSKAAAAINPKGRTNIVSAAKYNRAAAGYLWRVIYDDKVPRKIVTRYVNGRIPMSEETRQKISDAGRGRECASPSVETRLKMRQAKLGKSPANKGIPCTDAQRLKSKEASPTKKAVLQMTLDGVFVKRWPSIKEASQQTKATRCGISRCMLGKNQYAAGYKWRAAISKGEEVTITVSNPA